jgi:CheY-like chemotaxis protein
MSKLMIVDDQAIFRAQFRTAVEKSGIALDVIDAENGSKGIDLFEASEDVSVLVVDVHMPVMNGPDMLMELLKRHPERMDAIHFFMMTTEGNRKVRQEWMARGCSAWLIKPVDPLRFCEFLKERFAA